MVANVVIGANVARALVFVIPQNTLEKRWSPLFGLLLSRRLGALDGQGNGWFCDIILRHCAQSRCSSNANVAAACDMNGRNVISVGI